MTGTYDQFSKDSYILTNDNLRSKIPNYVNYELKILLTSILSDIVYFNIDDIIYQKILAILGVKVVAMVDKKNILSDDENTVKPRVIFFTSISRQERKISLELGDKINLLNNKYSGQYRKILNNLNKLNIESWNYDDNRPVELTNDSPQYINSRELILKIKVLKDKLNLARTNIQNYSIIYSDNFLHTLEEILNIYRNPIIDDNTIILAFKGSNYYSDFRLTNSDRGWEYLVSNKYDLDIVNDPKCHFYPGILESYNYLKLKIHYILRKYNHKSNIIITGHSKGGAEAQLCTLDLINHKDKIYKIFDDVNIGLITFASPNIGNSVVADLFFKFLNQSSPLKYNIRVLSKGDIINYSEYIPFTFNHILSGVKLNSGGTFNFKYLVLPLETHMSSFKQHASSFYIKNIIDNLSNGLRDENIYYCSILNNKYYNDLEKKISLDDDSINIQQLCDYRDTLSI